MLVFHDMLCLCAKECGFAISAEFHNFV